MSNWRNKTSFYDFWNEFNVDFTFEPYSRKPSASKSLYTHWYISDYNGIKFKITKKNQKSNKMVQPIIVPLYSYCSLKKRYWSEKDCDTYLSSVEPEITLFVIFHKKIAVPFYNEIDILVAEKNPELITSRALNKILE